MTDKCTQLNLSGSRRCADSTLTWTQRVPFDKQPKHPRPFSRVEIRTRTASCYLVKICMGKTQLASLVTSARQIVILVPRETHEHPAPPRNASTSQHITTSAQPTTNDKKEITTTATTTTTTTTTHNNNTQQQMHRHKNSNTTSHSNNSNNSGITHHQARTPTTVPSSRVPERTLSRIHARACAQKKHGQQQQQPQQQITSHDIKQHGNFVAPSRDSGSVIPAFCLEPQNARASCWNRGGPSISSTTTTWTTTITCGRQRHAQRSQLQRTI